MRLISIIISFIISIVVTIFDFLGAIISKILPFMDGIFKWISEKLNKLLPFLSTEENVFDKTTEVMNSNPNSWDNMVDISLMIFISVGAIIVIKELRKKE